MRALKLNQTDLSPGINQNTLSASRSDKIELVIDKFLPSEANNIISSVIDKKINLYKLQYLTLWEGDHSINTDSLNEKIMELVKKKKELENIINQAKEEGCGLNINISV